MKKKTSMALAALMLASSFAPQVLFAQGLTKNQKIEALKTNQLISGYADGSLGLDKNVKRSEMAKLLVYALGEEKAAEALKSRAAKFSDVDKNYWASGMIAWATEAQAPGSGVNYLAGYPGGTFGPEKNITNAEMLKILVVLAKKDLTADQVKNAKWPTDWIQWAKDAKVIGKGTDLENLDPNATASRESTFIALYNALDGNLKKVQETTTEKPAQTTTTTTAVAQPATTTATTTEKRDPLWNQKYFQQYVKTAAEKKEEENKNRDWSYYNSRRDRYSYDYDKRAWWDSYNREWIYDKNYDPFYSNRYDWVYDSDRGYYKRWDSVNNRWIYDYDRTYRPYYNNYYYNWEYDADSGYYRRWDSDNSRWVYDYDRTYRPYYGYNNYNWVYDRDNGYYKRWDSELQRWIYDYDRKYNNYWSTTSNYWYGTWRYWDDANKSWVYGPYSSDREKWYYDSENRRWWNYPEQRWYDNAYYESNVAPAK